MEQLVGEVRNYRSKQRGRPSSLDHEKRLSTIRHILLRRLHASGTKTVRYAACQNPEKRLCFFAKLAPESRGYTLVLAANHTTPKKMTNNKLMFGSYCSVFIAVVCLL